MTSRLLPVVCCCALVCATDGAAYAQDDGLRTVAVRRYGIEVRVPQAWSLIDWGTDDKAFVLSIPQTAGSPGGTVACELGVAPESLEEFRKRHEANDREEQKREQPRRKLIENRIEKLNPARYGQQKAEAIGQRLVTVWEQTDEKVGTWFELRARLISHDTLYTFILTSDEAHWDAYRADFEDMLQGAKFTPPETGLQRLPGGYWMQRDFRFALKLPPEWQPSFAPHDKVLFFATGAAHEVFTDNLLVLATPSRPLELDRLKESFQAAIQREDPMAEVVCRIVPQGAGVALETVIHTRRGEFAVSILQRQFQGQQRNYEVKFTCETAEFKRIEEQLRKALDSFREFQGEAKNTIL